MTKKKKLLNKDMAVPIGIVIVMSFLAFVTLEEITKSAGEGVTGVARGAQRAIIRSALIVIGVLGAARLALGFVGGPIMWSITGAAWILSGGFDTVASTLGLPTVAGITGRIKRAVGGGSTTCPPGTIYMPNSGLCGSVTPQG